MRTLLVAFALLGLVDRGLGQEKGATAATPPRDAEIEQRHALDTPTPQVLLRIQVIEISLTHLHDLGFDCLGPAQRGLFLDAHDKHHATKSNLPNSCVLASKDSPQEMLDALRKDHLAKVLSAPTLVTTSNRPCTLQVGGECRVAVPQGKGKKSVEDKFYGTRVDFLPVVSKDQMIHLTCRIELSHPDPANRVTIAGETVPVLEALYVDMTGDVRSGQTVIEGRLPSRRGPSAAAPRAESSPKKDATEEVETLVLVTPEIIEPKCPSKTPREATVGSRNAAAGSEPTR